MKTFRPMKHWEQSKDVLVPSLSQGFIRGDFVYQLHVASKTLSTGADEAGITKTSIAIALS